MSFSSGTFSIPHCPTYPAMPATSIQVEILSTKKMTALATFLRPLFFRVNFYGFWQGLCIVLASGVKQFFGWPILRNSVGEGSCWDTVFLRQLRNVVSNAVNCHESGTPSISRLLTLARPPAIFCLIVSIWVYAIKRISRRTITNIIKKCVERIEPTLTYPNSAPSVIVKPIGTRNYAANNHHRPSSVERVFIVSHLRFQSLHGIAGV